MDYFQHFDLTPRFSLDESDLRKKYLRISKQYHPDFFVNDPDKHEEALQMTSLNNKAYETLKDPRKRVAYLLRQEGLLSDKGGKLDPMFLMEMMDFNERISDAGMSDDAKAMAEIRTHFKQLESEMESGLTKACEACDADHSEATMKQVLEFYLKLRYLLRIKESIDKFAAL